LNRLEYRVRKIEAEAELCRWTAEWIAEGKVVGWFLGRMEWGVRASGLILYPLIWPEHRTTGQLLAELAEGLVREYACKIVVVVGPSLPNGKELQCMPRAGCR
jgi:hypothetical protein